MAKVTDKPLDFNDIWPDLLKAWAWHMFWAVLAVVLPTILGAMIFFDVLAVDAFDESAGSGWLLLLLVPIFLLGCILSVVAPWSYLRRKRYQTAMLITVIGVISGLLLPFGSLPGFLLGGYILERNARESRAVK